MVPPAVILLQCIRFFRFRPVVKPASYRNFRQAPSRSHPAYPYFTAFDLYSLFPQAGFTVGELFFSLKKHGVVIAQLPGSGGHVRGRYRVKQVGFDGTESLVFYSG